MASPSKLSRLFAGFVSVSVVASLAACGNNNENNEVDVGVTEDMSSNNETDTGGMTDMGTPDEDMGTPDEDMGTPDEDMGMTGDMGMTDDAGTDMGMTDMGMMLDGFVLFDDALASGLTFAPYGGSTNAISTSQDEAFSGTSSLKAATPAAGYTGGTYVTAAPEDLSAYNALSFQVKASQAATLDAVGYGNTGAEAVKQVELLGLPLTTDWQEVIIPIPDPSLADSNVGVFQFAENDQEGVYDIYFDEVRYVSVDPGDFTNSAPAFGATSTTISVGQTATPVGTVWNVDVRGEAKTFQVQPFWFEWTSSDPTVATVDSNGVVTGVAAGTAQITGTMAGVAAGGQLDVTVEAGPAAAAPTPSTLAADVEVSIFSDAYTNTTVDTYLAGFSAATLTQVMVAGDNVLAYGGLNFAGIEMLGANSVDISASTMLHFDIWTPDAGQFGIKLVDFGANNAFDNGGDDREGELFFTESTDFMQGQWVSFDIPLSDFEAQGLDTRANLSQIILSGRLDTAGTMPGGTLFIDNIYFY